MLIGEIWKPVPSLPEYMASSMGRIMRIPFEGQMPYGGWRLYGGKPSIGTWIEEGKRFCTNYRGRNYKIARLVCEAFHGCAPEGMPVCMHLDENSRNNRPENLAWGTQKENLNAPGFLEYCRSRTGENSNYAKWKRS